ncbi:unnamed protein product (macronuclear) [Paramecium tetraurelia]|uniref:Uncharacterized protein n=1 Tax=Paramecium tetraurelia TaxID=5888 RepID=A0DJW4_PARTE|nr:uncharacterized protein GSPATT00017675001 [Paramecium tetraurelia]CAK83331.1 unnamed protein product [Paramecium tetraurelia]|eukprot:XP_001450728.1 hypothetical protein (macronuclear) [Paramecium tetraurelia strain d4-2]
MINETFLNHEPEHFYDYFPTSVSCPQSELSDYESPIRQHYISSLCFQIKKKIKRQQNRPSFLKIEDSGRNVKLYSCSLSSNNTEKPENDTK